MIFVPDNSQPKMIEENILWVVAETEVAKETLEVDGRRSGEDVTGGFDSTKEAFEAFQTIIKRKRISLDAKALKTQMENMVSIVNSIFDQATSQTSLQLNEVELSVEINAEGQLSLIGNGGKLGNKGGITLKFIRPNDNH
ncbi:hypothetical protein [Leptolyngbya sp. PCC 6406]|uniref:Pepco domain-containing protein n=1 Tax=Leptolyngbya sp. PCC 6406 TaxID=1173264 RepID=UPI0002ABA4E5|nr:hypothetical protein [Leptolyngbya sp. PCC 6406]